MFFINFIYSPCSKPKRLNKSSVVISRLKIVSNRKHDRFIPQVSEKDGLPKTICTECAEKLDDFYNFRQLSRKVESTLVEICQSENNKSDSDCSISKTSETSKDKGMTDFEKNFWAVFQGHWP